LVISLGLRVVENKKVLDKVHTKLKPDLIADGSSAFEPVYSIEVESQSPTAAFQIMYPSASGIQL
jgi:hypothetical protein